jgi:hypothetical protein
MVWQVLGKALILKGYVINPDRFATASVDVSLIRVSSLCSGMRGSRQWTVLSELDSEGGGVTNRA